MWKAFLRLIKLPWIHFDFISLPLNVLNFSKTYRFWVISYFHFLWNFRLSSISTILKFQEKLQKVQIEFWWDKLSHSFPFTFRAWVETTDIPQLLICFTFPSFFGLFNQSFCWVTFSSDKGYFGVGLWIRKSHWEIGVSDVGDFMMVTVFGCWWQNLYLVCWWLFAFDGEFLNRKKQSQTP